MRIVRLISLAALLAAIAPAAAGAATFNVTRFDDPYPGPCHPGDCTLREAVLASNGNPGPDTIIAPAGDYILRLTGLDLPISDTVTIQGAGGQAVVDANGLQTGTRAFEVLNGGNATFEQVSAHSGNPAPDADTIARGGVIRVDSGGSLSITNGAVLQGKAPGSSAQGGGIYTAGQLALTDVTIADNQSGSGGGLYVDSGGNANVLDSVISSNDASSGGAVAGTGAAQFAGSLLRDNSAGFGGAVETNSCGSFRFTYTTISGNYAAQEGGAIYVEDANVFLSNATVSSNQSSADAGGLAVFHATGCSPRVFATNTILAANSDYKGYPDCHDLSAAGGLVASGGHNVIGDPSNCGFSTSLGDQFGSSGSPLDPKLAPLANNGGPTQTMALLPDSPAVEKGDRASCGSADQRGVLIGHDGDAGCDIGAYELQYAPSNAVAPTIVGGRARGSRLTCSAGVWAGARPMRFAYQWLRNGKPIAGSTPSHKITAADRRHRLACRVTATNVVGDAAAMSASVAIGR